MNMRNVLKASVESCYGRRGGSYGPDDGSSDMAIMIANGRARKVWAKALDKELPDDNEVYNTINEIQTARNISACL